MKKGILIIDDQKDIRDVYMQILGQNQSKAKSSLDLLEDELFADEYAELEKKDTAEEPAQPVDHYEVVCAAQGLEGVELVRKSLKDDEPFMVAFIDMRMPPGIDGMETAKRIRELDENIEIIIVTAFSDHLCSEIVDYIGSPSKLLFLKKPFDVEEIKQLTTNLTEKWLLNQQNREYTENLEKMVIERTKEIVEKNQTLERLATMDMLTELNNTQKFYDELEKEMARVKQIESEKDFVKNLVLVILDIDNLRKYNEIFGHWNGDMILKTIAQILRMSFRKMDIISRVGGDEFMAILPQTPVDQAKNICDRLIDLIIGKFSFKDMVYLLDRMKIDEIKKCTGYQENDVIQISITGAIVEYSGENCPEKFFNKAYNALMQSKQKDKNNFYIIT